VTDNIVISILSVVILILILIIGIVVVIMSARKQQVNQQLREANYKNKLHETSLAALRAQMNPHFIFNCLNSIRLYTEQNNTAAAVLYLNKFSKLIRKILDSAKAEMIGLSVEIETLQLFLELESMRFKEKLKFEIIVDELVDTDFIEVPPLLTQPYVENAIWHGIMHKETPGKVIITITQSKDDKNLIIKIKDDGVGRHRSKEIAAKSTPSHKSHGTLINQERITLLNSVNQWNASVEIIDLVDTTNSALGTLVTLKLPLI
jgi:LytS/YehU family sensor histidine kinase